MSTFRRVAFVAAALSFGTTAAFAGDWIPNFGNADHFSYSGGKDTNGLFGNPFVFGDTFFFTGANFHVNSEDGAPAGGFPENEWDVAEVDVLADPGWTFSLIRVTAFGSYAVTGGTPLDTYADLDAGLSIDENGGMGRNWSGDLVTQPMFPVNDTTVPNSGDYDGLSAVDISFVLPAPHNSLHVELSNDLLVVSTQGSSAELNMRFEDLKIEMVLIPEPASLALMAVGGLALLRRRR